MKKSLSIFVVFILAAAAFGNGVSLNSPGTRAISMAGAYISHTDDYSTPYWNPAGLMNVEGAQLSFFLTDLIPMATYKNQNAATGIDIDATAVTNHYLAPNLSFLWTCKLYEKMHMGLSVIVPAGLGVEWEGEEFVTMGGPQQIPGPVNNNFYGNVYDWESSIAVLDISLSLAHKIGNKMNIGAGFHLLNGSMSLKRGWSAVSNFDPTFQSPDEGYLDSQYEEESDGWGYGLSLGLQYSLTEKLNFGAAMRTKMTVGFSGDAKVTNDILGSLADYSFDRDVSWPMWIGGGFSYQFSEKFLLALEGTWSQWSETEDYLFAKHDGVEDTLTLLWDDALQIRLGGEYWLTERWAMRAGFYIDPAPGPAKTQTILIPQADYNVITGGIGYKLEKWSFDFALEYLFGEDVEVTEDEVLEGVGMVGTHGINILVPSFAVTYKFK